MLYQRIKHKWDLLRTYGTVFVARDRDVERFEWSFYINYLRPGMIVFDVGANTGELTLLFSKFVRTRGIVHSFEATSETFGHLKTICQLSNRNNIVLNNVAVANTNDTVEFFTYADHPRLNTLAHDSLSNYGIQVEQPQATEVQAVTIDQYCDQNGIKQIDLLKIDVEGAEYQVLLGADQMFRRKQIACCIFEFGRTTLNMGNKSHEIKQFFHSRGYTVRNNIRRNPTFPGGSDPLRVRFSMHIAKPR